MGITKRDLEQAHEDLHDKYEGRLEDYFAPLYLASTFKRPIEDVIECCAFGGHDYGFDAFWVDVERRNLYLYQFKWSENHGLFKDSFKRLISDGFARIFGNPFQDQHQNDLVSRLKDALFENQSIVERVFVCFVFNGIPEKAEQSPVLDALRESLESKKYLVDDYFGGRPIALSIEYISNEAKKARGGPRRTRTTHRYEVPLPGFISTGNTETEQLHVGLLRLWDLYEMHREMQDRLFERNIRSGLNPDKPTNRELRRAFHRVVIDASEPAESFVLNHNGVTIAAEKVSIADGIMTIVEPRVLNGAQTITSFKQFVLDEEENPAFKRNLDRAKAMRVLAKVIPTTDAAVITRVTLCTNRQNPVEPWHLRASDEIQLELQEKFANELGIFYERQENSFSALTDEDLEERGIEDSKAIAIKRLAQTFLAAQGDVDKMSRMPDVFEDDKLYRQTFQQRYLTAPADRIVLAYKVQFKLRRLVQEISDRGENKYGYLAKARNLVWALLVQALLNDSHVDRWRTQFGSSLRQEADFGELLKKVASTRVRFAISEAATEPKYKEAISGERYDFLRTRAFYDRCMEAAHDRWGWVRKNL